MKVMDFWDGCTGGAVVDEGAVFCCDGVGFGEGDDGIVAEMDWAVLMNFDRIASELLRMGMGVVMGDVGKE